MNTTFETPPGAMSVAHVTEFLSVGRTKVYELINSGELKTVKVGRRTLVLADSVYAILERAC